jgi:hypothetical protein
VASEQSQQDVASAVRECRLLLAAEVDLATSALAAAGLESPAQLADAGEELLECHSRFAAKYRRLLATWLRPSDQPDDPPARRGPPTAPDGSRAP